MGKTWRIPKQHLQKHRKMRVIAIHLLNDYSGSPKVLSQTIKVWVNNGLETHLFTCGGREGFLSDIPKVHNHKYWYRFSSIALIRLVFFMTSQFFLAIKLLFFLKKNDIVYINTVLPFGAGLVAKLKKNKVIYHVHETSIKPIILKKLLFGVAKYSATKTVYVSNFLAQAEPISKNFEILHNVLEEDFLMNTNHQEKSINTEKIVLMICSLKKYKGVFEFIELAKINSAYTFKLVLNATEKEIQFFFEKTNLPKNLVIYPTQKNTIPFYKEASVIVNLSDVDLWVETFGLTVLEGMAFGLPAIVPPIGGVTEVVDDGINGYFINSKNLDLISERLQFLFTYPEFYKSFSHNALEKSKIFSISNFEKKALQILSNL